MKPPINLSHLKFFCDAVSSSSVSESAKLNFVSQSAVSQAINKLEQILGVQLLIHTRQRFLLTDEGKILFEHSRHIFKSVDEIHEKINQNKNVVQGAVKFVSTRSLGKSLVASLYKQVQTSLPDVNLRFYSGGLNFITKALRQGEAEFALVVYDHNFANFNKIPIKKGYFQLYQSVDAPQQQIENGILVDYVGGPFVNELLSHFANSDLPNLKIHSELSGWEMVARFTEMNIGVGFFPNFVTANNRYPSIQIHPMGIPPYEYEICVIFNKGEKLSRAASSIVDKFTTLINKDATF